MTYEELFKLPDGTVFQYKGKPAKKIWGEHTNYLVVKSWWNPKKNQQEPDVYFKAWVVYFEAEGRPEGISLTFSFPKIEAPVSEGYELPSW